MTTVAIEAGRVSEWKDRDIKVYNKILEKHADINTDHAWWECTKDELIERMGAEGVAIDNAYFSGFWSQGDGACFTGVVHAKYLNAHGIMGEDVSGRLYLTPSHYSHENTVELELYDTEEDGEAVLSALRNEMRAYYRTLEKECEYLMSEEAIVETLEANEWLFDNTGRIVG